MSDDIWICRRKVGGVEDGRPFGTRYYYYEPITPYPAHAGEVEVLRHAANPHMIKIKGLVVKPVPECEGGGYYLMGEVAEFIARLLDPPDFPKDDE